MKQTLSFTTFFVILMFLSACAATPKRVIFNKDNPTMESILQGNAGHGSTFSKATHGRDTIETTSDGHVVTQPAFRELNNPTLYLHIEPHVTKGGTHVPSIIIPYKQYNKVEFALPGEW